jgi:hypothetical protein
MIISVAIITAGPQLTKAANQSSGSRKMLLSSCMAPFSTKTDVNGNDLEVVPLCSVSRMLNKSPPARASRADDPCRPRPRFCWKEDRGRPDSTAKCPRGSISALLRGNLENRDLVKLFHSYQATKPFSGTDEAISSSQEDIPKQALDMVAGSNNQTREAP